MSILGSISNGAGGGRSTTGTPIFSEFKKQASFFLKEKIKTARLALTDVTPVQLLAEEATNGNPGGVPDARTLKMISRAAFEVDDYWRIVEILHKRLVKFDRRDWWASYKAVVVLEHLLTHGPERVAEEFQCRTDVITEMVNFQHVDEKGFNWGVSVRNKSERILKLLEKGPLFKEERDKARKISRGIQGFGSFSHRADLQSSVKPFDRCNSNFNNYNNQENIRIDNKETLLTVDPRVEGLIRGEDLKENLAPNDEVFVVAGESKALLGEEKDESKNAMLTGDHHPFDDVEHLTSMSLLSTAH